MVNKRLYCWLKGHKFSEWHRLSDTKKFRRCYRCGSVFDNGDNEMLIIETDAGIMLGAKDTTP